MWRGGVGGKCWIVDGRGEGERALRVVEGADPYRWKEEGGIADGRSVGEGALRVVEGADPYRGERKVGLLTGG